MTENTNRNSDEFSTQEAFNIVSQALEKFVKDLEKASQPASGFYKTAEEIFRWHGIKVRMRNEKNEPHHLPHVHIENGSEQKVSLALNGSILAGSCDKKTLNKIRTFLNKNHDILEKMWKAIINGQNLKPLKNEILAIK